MKNARLIGLVVATACLTWSSMSQASSVRVYHFGGNEKWMPPHTRGDQDFSGNPYRFRAHVHFFPRFGALYCATYVEVRETKGDRTTAKGWSPVRLVYQPEKGMRVTSVFNGYRPIVDKVKQGHRIETLPTPFVGNVEIYGDRRGNDAGVYTGVRIKYDAHVAFRVERYKLRPEVVKVNLPNSLTVVPRLTRGDTEFKGHGPHINAELRIWHDSQKVFAYVHMRAVETKPNWSTASGWVYKELYRVPKGMRIAGFDGLRNPYVLPYDHVDAGHRAHIYPRGRSLARFTVFGDRRGKDVGQYTRLVVMFPGKSLRVRIVPM